VFGLGRQVVRWGKGLTNLPRAKLVAAKEKEPHVLM
jgi:hypothetical protein